MIVTRFWPSKCPLSAGSCRSWVIQSNPNRFHSATYPEEASKATADSPHCVTDYRVFDAAGGGIAISGEFSCSRRVISVVFRQSFPIFSIGKMSIDKYDPIRVLGEGSFGKVYLMRDKVRRTFVCVKVIKIKNIPKKEREATKMEVDLLRRLHHPNIVRYIDSFLSKNNESLCICMEYCDGVR